MQFEDPRPLFLLLLFLHIGGAILAFGPSFAMPIIGAAGGREPEHVGFATRLSETIATQRIVPLAIWVGVTGVLLIIVSGRSLGELWLSLAILLYVTALTFSFVVAAPNTRKLVEATNAPRPEPAPGSAPPSGPPPSGPPPHIAKLVANAQRNGMVLGILVVLILLLMVFKPTL